MNCPHCKAPLDDDTPLCCDRCEHYRCHYCKVWRPWACGSSESAYCDHCWARMRFFRRRAAAKLAATTRANHWRRGCVRA